MGLIREVHAASPFERSLAGKVLVVMIPAFNEAATVGNVVRKIPRRIAGIEVVKVLVIDDGSHDETGLKALQAGADHVVRHDRNLGLGVAFRDGLEQALALGADVVVNIDADEQHEASEIPSLIAPILEGTADVVLGNRNGTAAGPGPWSKKIGNRIATLAIRWATRLPIRDGQAGFRALSRDAGLRMHLQEDYTFTHEMLFLAAEHNLRIRHVPVAVTKRDGNSRLVPSIWKYALREAGILLRGYARYRPLRLFGMLGVVGTLLGSLVALGLYASALTGDPTKLLFADLAVVILVLNGLLTAAIGVLAETKRMDRRLQEEILYRLKKATLVRDVPQEPGLR